MHKIPLTEIEESGLRAFGLDIGTPSQLSDAFRHGVAWGQRQLNEVSRHGEDVCEKCGGRGWYTCGASDQKRKCPYCDAAIKEKNHE